MQIYRGFDIGTGKPSAAERSAVPHHLLDVAEPLESWDAARWATKRSRAVEDDRRARPLPIVCGGTFLWVRALIYGLADARAATTKSAPGTARSPKRKDARLCTRGWRRSTRPAPRASRP
jgi:tRNA A37 N6-isopentenylltransferase MiaA